MEKTDKPHDKRPDSQTWWAEGDLFEGCNCNLLCPCHVTFHQPPPISIAKLSGASP